MPWAKRFCPFRAYWVISTVQVEVIPLLSPLPQQGVATKLCLLAKGEIIGRVGMERAMLERGPHGCPLLHPLLRTGGEIGLDKPLPEVIDGLLRGMEHVGRIEAVVAEFVVQQLIGGKIR